MKTSKIEQMARLLNSLAELGFSYSEAKTLLRIERTLQRWGERMCGDGNGWGSWCIERDETTDKPYLLHHHYNHGRGKDYTTRTPIRDLEKSALARLAKLMAEHPGLVAYHQTDPRGCALYVMRREDIPSGSTLDACYTRGLAVCI